MNRVLPGKAVYFFLPSAFLYLSLISSAYAAPGTLNLDNQARLLVSCTSAISTNPKPCEQKAKKSCDGEVKLLSVKPPAKINVTEGTSQHQVTIEYRYDTVYQCQQASQ